MSYTGILEAYTFLLYSLMATNILNFVSVEHLALVTISNHIKHPVLMYCTEKGILQMRQKSFILLLYAVPRLRKMSKNMKNQFIRNEFEVCKVYFKTVMQNVLGVTTEAKQVSI